MTRQFAALTILVTTLVFTVVGVVVGYLISSSIAQVSTGHVNQAGFLFMMSYVGCTLGGVVVGLATSCFAVWLVGIKTRD